jgi:hypothetical protein
VLNFLNPWGLLALSSLGGVLFLYFYVFRGRRREVSALFLWDPDRGLRREGRKRRRPPVDLPLMLELLVALLLSLVVAGLFYQRTEENPHLVLILDSSASMNASGGGEDLSGRALDAVRELADDAGGEVRISLVESFGGRILGGGVVSVERAGELLGDWHPAAPPHGLQQAVEVARSLQSDSRPVPLITDQRREGVGFGAIGVGQALANTGWVGGRWAEGNEIFARLRHFGSTADRTEIVVRDAGGKELSRREVDFSDRPSVPLTLRVPAGVASVRLELPDDALSNDNVLRLVRPARRALPVHIEVENEDLAAQIQRALGAAGGVQIIEEGRPAMLCTSLPERADGPVREELRIRFRLPDKESVRTYTGPYFLDTYSPLTRGLDLKGTIWGADPGFAPEGWRPLVSAGDVRLVAMRGNRMVVNLAPERTNLFRQPAWPVLVSNALDHVRARMPGVKRFSYRLGESLSFVRPHRWKGTVVVEDPTGRKTPFDAPHVYYGVLQREGIYRIYPESAPEDAVAVAANLLAEEESDLRGAETFDLEGNVHPGELAESRPRTFHRLFALAAAAALLGCWYVLERRN